MIHEYQGNADERAKSVFSMAGSKQSYVGTMNSKFTKQSKLDRMSRFGRGRGSSVLSPDPHKVDPFKPDNTRS